jgi:hypothetical protein
VLRQAGQSCKAGDKVAAGATDHSETLALDEHSTQLKSPGGCLVDRQTGTGEQAYRGQEWKDLGAETEAALLNTECD